MKPEEFVELVSRLTTSREADEGSDRCEADSTLDSLIGVARDLSAQAFAQSSGLSATELFDVLGGGIMSCGKGAGVLVRHRGVEARVGSVDVREDAIVLDLMMDPVEKGEKGEEEDR